MKLSKKTIRNFEKKLREDLPENIAKCYRRHPFKFYRAAEDFYNDINLILEKANNEYKNREYTYEAYRKNEKE